VTRLSGVMMSAGGEATPKKRGWDDASWADTNLTGPKMKKIHAVDSVAINGR
jgi:hypothetical protein